MARSIWQSAVNIGAMDMDHPAWTWLKARHLWRQKFPLPRALRWLPASAHWTGRASTPAPVQSSPWLRRPGRGRGLARTAGTPGRGADCRRSGRHTRPGSAGQCRRPRQAYPWAQERRRRGFRLPRSDPSHGTGESWRRRSRRPGAGQSLPRPSGGHPKLKPRWDVHLSGDDDQLGCADESLSSVLGE